MLLRVSSKPCEMRESAKAPISAVSTWMVAKRRKS